MKILCISKASISNSRFMPRPIIVGRLVEKIVTEKYTHVMDGDGIKEFRYSASEIDGIPSHLIVQGCI